MKLSIACTAILVAPVAAFAPASTFQHKTTALNAGYLDHLGGALPPEEEVEEDDSREATMMEKESLDRAGPGNWNDFVEFQ